MRQRALGHDPLWIQGRQTLEIVPLDVLEAGGVLERGDVPV